MYEEEILGGDSKMEKIKMSTPIVEMNGDERWQESSEDD